MIRLPVWQTVVDAHRFVFENRRDFLLLASVPVLLQALLFAVASNLASGPWTRGAAAQQGSGEAAAITVDPAIWFVPVIALVSIGLYVMFSVAWHRRLLVADERPTVASSFRWGRRQTRFLLRLILIGFLSAVTYVLLSFVVAGTIITLVTAGGQEELNIAAVLLATVAVLLLTGSIYCRYLPWLPAAAVDRPLSIGQAWRLGHGNTWRLLWIFAIPSFEFAIPVQVLAWVATFVFATTGLGDTLTGLFVYFLIAQGIGYTGLAVTVSCLSIAFRDLLAAHPTTASGAGGA